eukprot:11707859-Ditylum_brightwellii.AAC.1
MERAANQVNSVLAAAMDDGVLALAMAKSAIEEKGWPAKVRNRIVEEFLFETEEGGDGPIMDDEEEDSTITPDRDERKNTNGSKGNNYDVVNGDPDIVRGDDSGNNRSTTTAPSTKEEDIPFGAPGSTIHAKDDIYLGGGNGGVFFDYSESNAHNAPYQGELGPLLLDAVVERARQNQPKVIAIGDVHGCIDELQALLRQCDYSPGDLIVFLGDLVSKGPDSAS